MSDAQDQPAGQPSKSRLTKVSLRLACAALGAGLVGLGVLPALAQIFPTDSADLSKADIPGHPFSSWFEGGTISAGGMVNPPDGVNFEDLQPGEQWGDWRATPSGLLVPPPGQVVLNPGGGHYAVAGFSPGNCVSYAPSWVKVPPKGSVTPLDSNTLLNTIECGATQIISSWPPPGFPANISEHPGFSEGPAGVYHGPNAIVFDGGGYTPEPPPTGPASPFTGQFPADFQRWAYRMFLHVTSPSSDTPSGSEPVFMSPEFYVLSTPDAAGEYTLTPQSKTSTHKMDVRKNKPATSDFAIIHDKAGVAYQIVPAMRSDAGNPLAQNASGKQVEIGAVALDGAGRAKFTDGAGKPVQIAQILSAASAREHIGPALPGTTGASGSTGTTPPTPLKVAVKFIVGGKIVFTDPKGNIIPTDDSVGQADGYVQMTKAVKVGDSKIRSLIYYNIEVNDVWAYYRTMYHDNADLPDKSAFPTTSAQLDKIQNFAQSHGKSIAHPNALAVELKTAWVDAAVVKHPDQYITVTAQVPTYDTSNAQHWVQNGTKSMKVALVGMHIVGSAQGHPDLIWATFEHLGNAPDYGYAYVNSQKQVINVGPSQGSGDWLFNDESGPGPSLILPGATAGANGSIDAVGTGPVRGAVGVHLSPFGTPSDFGLSSLFENGAYANSSVISLNVDVARQMPDSDPRKYYYLVGALWTLDGTGSTGQIDDVRYSILSGPLIEGSPFLANSTMETFEQADTLADGATPRGQANVGCFSCHGQSSNDRANGDTTVLSHVFHQTKPLF